MGAGTLNSRARNAEGLVTSLFEVSAYDTMAITEFDELRVYQQAYDAAVRIFENSTEWPREETYALTDQIRRSSRSVCANVAEAWRKRRYEQHFVSKLSDADAEAAETRTWLRFARDCGYLSMDSFDTLDDQYNQICGGLVKMMKNPTPWCGPDEAVRESDLAYEIG